MGCAGTSQGIQDKAVCPAPPTAVVQDERYKARSWVPPVLRLVAPQDATRGVADPAIHDGAPQARDVHVHGMPLGGSVDHVQDGPFLRPVPAGDLLRVSDREAPLLQPAVGRVAHGVVARLLAPAHSAGHGVDSVVGLAGLSVASAVCLRAVAARRPCPRDAGSDPEPSPQGDVCLPRGASPGPAAGRSPAPARWPGGSCPVPETGVEQQLSLVGLCRAGVSLLLLRLGCHQGPRPPCGLHCLPLQLLLRAVLRIHRMSPSKS